MGSTWEDDNLDAYPAHAGDISGGGIVKEVPQQMQEPTLPDSEPDAYYPGMDLSDEEKQAMLEEEMKSFSNEKSGAPGIKDSIMGGKGKYILAALVVLIIAGVIVYKWRQ